MSRVRVGVRSLRGTAPGLLSAIVSATLLIAGCGGTGEDRLPQNAVAEVGDTLITRSDFEQQVRQELASRDQDEKGRVSYDPPTFTACVASKRADTNPGENSKAELRKACKEEYDAIEIGAVRALIRSEWVRQEAKERGIQVSASELKAAAEKSKAEAFAGDKGYREYLAAAGTTDEDYVAGVEVDVLAAKLSRRLTRAASEFSSDQIAGYYQEHKKQFVQAEKRGVRLVAISSRGRAEQAKNALESGQPWKKVVRAYSTPEIADLVGAGVVPWDRGGGLDGAVDRAIFDARLQEISGPVKAEDSPWVVFKVEWTKPPRQRSLAEAQEEVRKRLEAERGSAIEREYESGHRARTTCAQGFRIPDCSNAQSDA